MPAPLQRAEQQQARRQGLFTALLGLPWRILGLLLVSLLLSVLLEYLGLLFFWSEQGWRHSQAMLQVEVDWLGEHFQQSLIVAQPGQGARQFIDWMSSWVFERSGVLDYAQRARTLARDDGAAGWGAQLYILVEDFILATSLFALALLTGLVDGLIRRDLRKFGAGRESSFVYHRAKGLVMPLLIAPWMIYLTLPISLNPLLILLPCAVMLGMAVAITAATFKKYL